MNSLRLISQTGSPEKRVGLQQLFPPPLLIVKNRLVEEKNGPDDNILRRTPGLQVSPEGAPAGSRQPAGPRSGKGFPGKVLRPPHSLAIFAQDLTTTPW
jgi:hypothetical protein